VATMVTRSTLTLLLLASVAVLNGKCDDEAPGQKHAILISGITCDWGFCPLTYPVEAEISHAYHLLTQHGVPAENIVVFLEDVVVNSTYSNPQPGTLYDSLALDQDWYAGVKIDYKGTDVSADNFFAVLKGEKDKVKGGSGRVIQSGPNDQLFIYHGGHGDVGLLVVQDTYITKKELHKTLSQLQDEGKYNQLAYFIMACYSGSMFEDILEDDGPIYGVSAATPHESAYPYQELDFQTPEGEWYYTFVNTEFGSAWLNDTKGKDFNQETLQEQYENIAAHTDSSHASPWGNLDVIQKQTVSTFHGSAVLDPDPSGATFRASIGQRGRHVAAIDRHTELRLAKEALARTHDEELHSNLVKKIAELEAKPLNVQGKINSIVGALTAGKPRASYLKQQVLLREPLAVTKVDCHHDVVEAIWQHCPAVTRSAHLHAFLAPLVNLCESGVESASIVAQLQKTC